ncbi:hypothetical protein PQX77_000803 [Marasmius sp. AFHP31]|nr:hypothetical protein PQX77_000803 [Marasmius sp. AFHP31]
MSARTPFIPGGSRPSSRIAQKNDQNAEPAISQQVVTGQFTPDLNSPLHRTDASSKAQSIQKLPEKPSSASKPLNLNGFMKKSGPNQAPAHSPSRQTNLTRSRRDNPTSDSHSTENTLARREPAGNSSFNLITPVPRIANHSHPQPNSPESVFNTSTLASRQMATESENFKLNVSLSKGVPPQRVPVEENPSLPGLIPRNRSKRLRPDEDQDQDQDLMYLGSATGATTTVGKRYKPQMQQLDNPSEADYMRHSFSPQPFSSPVAPSHSGSDYLTSPKGANMYHQQNGEAHPGNLLPGSQNRLPNFDGNSLDRLLGCQTNAYVEDHMERYQQMATKWQECTMEEWVKGAEEIMGKYSKVLDFVKQHMESKLKLFASFDNKVDNHKTVLEERAKVLKGARQKLVSNSQTLLGGGAISL